MQILVVTCTRDQWQFQIQCWSFCKYLSRTTINIVVNELEAEPWLEWYEANCKKYLWRHQVCVYTLGDFAEFYNYAKKTLPKPFSGGGWKTQQALKLLFSLKTNKRYLVLDSKNWVVANSKVEDFVSYRRCLVDNPFKDFANSCHTKFNLIHPHLYRPSITPFWIDPDIVNSMFNFFGNEMNACIWLMQCHNPSEFIMYDLYATSRGYDQLDTGTNHEYSKTYWVGSTPPSAQEIQQHVKDPNIKMLSLHRPVLELMDTNMIEKAIGFSTKYFYWRL